MERDKFIYIFHDNIILVVMINHVYILLIKNSDSFLK